MDIHTFFACLYLRSLGIWNIEDYGADGTEKEPQLCFSLILIFIFQL